MNRYKNAPKKIAQPLQILHICTTKTVRLHEGIALDGLRTSRKVLKLSLTNLSAFSVHNGRASLVVFGF
jgi:hypothetical protein